jgi:hypothetical protein
MNIKDEQFKEFHSVSDYGNPVYRSKALALKFAGILADMVKHKASRSDRQLWASVPEIGADAKRLDIVKDYSIRGHDKSWDGDVGGQVGIVTEVREIRKRDGRTAIQVEIVFFNHTVLQFGSERYRKVEFIKG